MDFILFFDFLQELTERRDLFEIRDQGLDDTVTKEVVSDESERLATDKAGSGIVPGKEVGEFSAASTAKGTTEREEIGEIESTRETVVDVVGDKLPDAGTASRRRQVDQWFLAEIMSGCARIVHWSHLPHTTSKFIRFFVMSCLLQMCF